MSLRRSSLFGGPTRTLVGQLVVLTGRLCPTAPPHGMPPRGRPFERGGGFWIAGTTSSSPPQSACQSGPIMPCALCLLCTGVPCHHLPRSLGSLFRLPDGRPEVLLKIRPVLPSWRACSLAAVLVLTQARSCLFEASLRAFRIFFSAFWAFLSHAFGMVYIYARPHAKISAKTRDERGARRRSNYRCYSQGSGSSGSHVVSGGALERQGERQCERGGERRGMHQS